MLSRWSRICTALSRSPSTHPNSHEEITRGELLLDCQENHGQEITLFQNRWQGLFWKQTTRKMGSQVETWIQDCWYWAWWTLPAHWKSGHREDKDMQHKAHSTWTTHWVLEHWHTIQQTGKNINHPANLLIITLNNWRWMPYSCR